MLTIREAAENTGHSPHKIRRLIKAIADQPTHADRALIEPTPADVERLTAEGVQFTWRIDDELVRRELGNTPAESTGEKAAGGVGGGESPELLALLQRALEAKEHAEARLFEQLQVKDEQMRMKDQQIGALNERLRESNVLMASLQKQLPDPTKAPAAVLEAGQPSSNKSKGKGTAPPPKKQRRTWLRLFS